jgi:hypothetical protein
MVKSIPMISGAQANLKRSSAAGFVVPHNTFFVDLAHVPEFLAAIGHASIASALQL